MEDGYITPGSGTNGDPGDQKVIGNSTPRYEYSFRLGADYKGFDFSIFCQGIGKPQIWGSGQLAIPGYDSKEGACLKRLQPIIGQRRIQMPSIPEHGIWEQVIPDSECNVKVSIY